MKEQHHIHFIKIKTWYMAVVIIWLHMANRWRSEGGKCELIESFNKIWPIFYNGMVIFNSLKIVDFFVFTFNGQPLNVDHITRVSKAVEAPIYIGIIRLIPMLESSQMTILEKTDIYANGVTCWQWIKLSCDFFSIQNDDFQHGYKIIDPVIFFQ